MPFREAHEDDFQVCLPLLRQLWPALNEATAAAGPADLEALRSVFCRLVKAPDAQVLVVEENRRVIALMDLTFRETLFHRGPTMIIEDLIVDEAHRRQGLGSELVRRAEDIARRWGCRGIELSSDLHRAATRRFWEGRGYKCEAYQFRKIIHP
jgi:GNAT superfamily N-acetyltransferase